MAATASQSVSSSDWPSTMRPVSAANTGLMLMKTPKNPAGTRRSARMSATIGTAEHKMPAVAARPSAAPVSGWLARTQMPGRQPHILQTRDIDDWLTIIAAGGGIGITPEGTTAQYRRDGVVFRPLRDAPPIAVQMIWRQHDPHPSTHAAIAMLTDLYRRPS